MTETEVTLFERYIGNGNTVSIGFHPTLGAGMRIGDMFHLEHKSSKVWLMMRELSVNIEQLSNFNKNQLLLKAQHNQDYQEQKDNEMITCFRCDERKIKRKRFHKQDGCCDYCWQQGWRTRWNDDKDDSEYYNQNTDEVSDKY
jgi:uncharacterized paraquat-inducible protein A